MDDISKLQKINELARELMKHGQAQSMEEAVKKATEQIYGGDVSEQVPEAPSPDEPVQVAEPLPEVLEHADTSPEHTSDGDRLSSVDNKVSQQQTILSRMTIAVNANTQQLNVIESKINGLIAELTTIKSELNNIKESPVSPPMKKKDSEQGQTQFKHESVPPQPTQTRKPDGTGHVRSGNYTSDDVSIEKVFYYGGK